MAKERNTISPVIFQLKDFRSSETFCDGSAQVFFCKDEIITKCGSRLKAHATDSN